MPTPFLGHELSSAFFLNSKGPKRLTIRAVAPCPGLSSWSCFQFPPFLWLPSELNSSPALAHFLPIRFLGSQTTPSLPVAPSFFSLSPALINVLSKSPRLPLWNLFCPKSESTCHRLAWEGPTLGLVLVQWQNNLAYLLHERNRERKTSTDDGA